MRGRRRVPRRELAGSQLRRPQGRSCWAPPSTCRPWTRCTCARAARTSSPRANSRRPRRATARCWPGATRSWARPRAPPARSGGAGPPPPTRKWSATSTASPWTTRTTRSNPGTSSGSRGRGARWRRPAGCRATRGRRVPRRSAPRRAARLRTDTWRTPRSSSPRPACGCGSAARSRTAARTPSAARMTSTCGTRLPGHCLLTAP
mmetsp:Transcript_43636/g.123513  ORF Transcript_43636/g.123513 Transcript_43636/m.123513 type:complete len:205 (-) Transcript_43636:125-739(-)